MIIMQGDSYYEGIEILNNAGNPVTPNDVINIEITIGHLRKSYLNAEIVYSDGLWLYPIRRPESFRMYPGAAKSEVTVFWANGAVESKPLYGVRIGESINKEVW